MLADFHSEASEVKILLQAREIKAKMNRAVTFQVRGMGSNPAKVSLFSSKDLDRKMNKILAVIREGVI